MAGVPLGSQAQLFEPQKRNFEISSTLRADFNAYIDASPHACFTRGQKVEFSINTSGISQAFTIMMALAGNFDSKGGQNIGREPATGYDSFMFDVVPNQKGRMGQRRKETAMNIKKLSVCQNTGYQDILVADIHRLNR